MDISSPWGFGSVIAIVLGTIFVLWQIGGYIDISTSGIKIGKKDKEKRKTSPHSTCPHARDIMEVVRRTIEYSEKRQELKNSLIEEQMRFYEETEEEVIGLLKNVFIKALAKKLNDNISYAQNNEYSNYVITLKAIFIDIKSYVKTCFKSNHYAYMSAENQLTYMEKKKTILSQKLSESLNIYWRGEIISRAELYKFNSEKAHVLEGYAEEVFNRAFLLSRETYARIERLEEGYQEYISSIVGTDNGSLIIGGKK